MEAITVKLDPDRFDAVVHPPSLAEGGDLELVMKMGCTVEGSPGVAITFSVTAPGASGALRAQAVTTLRALALAVRALEAMARREGWERGGREDS